MKQVCHFVLFASLFLAEGCEIETNPVSGISFSAGGDIPTKMLSGGTLVYLKENGFSVSAFSGGRNLWTGAEARYNPQTGQFPLVGKYWPSDDGVVDFYAISPGELGIMMGTDPVSLRFERDFYEKTAGCDVIVAVAGGMRRSQCSGGVPLYFRHPFPCLSGIDISLATPIPDGYEYMVTSVEVYAPSGVTFYPSAGGWYWSEADSVTKVKLYGDAEGMPVSGGKSAYLPVGMEFLPSGGGGGGISCCRFVVGWTVRRSGAPLKYDSAESVVSLRSGVKLTLSAVLPTVERGSVDLRVDGWEEQPVVDESF